MTMWNDLDETTQKIIKYGLIVTFLVISVLAWFLSIRNNDKLNTPMLIERFPIKEIKLVSSEQKKGDYYINFIDMVSGKRYDNVFLTSHCPNYKVLPGKKMYVFLVLKAKLSTGEEFIEVERAYDYICTNKNMDEADKKIEDEFEKENKDLKKVLNAPLPDKPIVPLTRGDKQ